MSCLLVTLIVGFVAPAGSELRRQFAFSWLFAFLYFFTILIGCFFWIIVHHATDSGWGMVVRRQMENLATLLPWMVLFFLPLFIVHHDFVFFSVFFFFCCCSRRYVLPAQRPGAACHRHRRQGI